MAWTSTNAIVTYPTLESSSRRSISVNWQASDVWSSPAPATSSPESAVNRKGVPVLVLDFGGQYTQLIARRVREAHVYCEIASALLPWAELASRRPQAVILSGGPASVYEPAAPQADPALLQAGLPVLGICYGMQWMAQVLGGDVRRSDEGEYGPAQLERKAGGRLFADIPFPTRVWMSHGDQVLQPPAGFATLAATAITPVAAMGDEKRRLYGVQFHPEVVHTEEGERILRNFLFSIAGLAGDWTMGRFREETVARIRATVGQGKAVCALSGGVDSATAAVLVHQAIGSQLTCVFVDHGLLRAGEAEEVVRTFRDRLGVPLVHVQAQDRFLARLAGVTDPEEKRRRIGEEFIRVFEEEAERLGDVRYLVQGTLYPDVIESGGGRPRQRAGGAAGAALIKSHHNVGGLPEHMKLQLIEPLRWLFKDEVRQLAAELGLPETIVWRHPFPGPGLAVRMIGEVTRPRLERLRAADQIVLEEIQRAGLERAIWQVFAVLPGVRTVGVMGDERSYTDLVAVRAVTSEDGMTADWARIPYDVLERISTRIMNEVKGVNRVVYDISPKPPATIEWE
ncbi:MAG: glutamine-hydrolyzing GMP synthase [Limnochordaceae bacterium]|nr:glutamine-hydrolyzing GMP synthase [Limnochordaceae bacterium]